MIKNLNDNKILIISHIADIDGMGSVILGKKFYDNKIDYIFAEVNDLPELFENTDFTNYEIIYVCDLPFSPSTIGVLDKHNEIVKKIKHFDHHSSYGEYMPSYINAVTFLNDRKTCGTELFYNYLLTLDNKLDTQFYKVFVEATREQDTWEFGEQEYYAKLLASIHALINSNSYVDLICSLDEKIDFSLPIVFEDLYKSDLDKQKTYINHINNNLLITEYKQYKIGITIAEQYRSIIGDEICKINQDLDFVMIINFNRNSVSLRCTKDNIDLNKICLEFHHDGGGHKKAAGFILDSESIPKIEKYYKDYLDNIKKIRKDII